jgi:hypothetical protein
MGRSYRPTAYLGFGRVYFNIAASDAPEPLSPFTECAVGLSLSRTTRAPCRRMIGAAGHDSEVATAISKSSFHGALLKTASTAEAGGETAAPDACRE